MTFTLNPIKLKYSPTERKVFRSLASGKKIDSKTLTRINYGRQTTLNGSIMIVTAVRHLAAKAVRNKEAWCVRRSRRRGPYPMEFWLEERG